MLGGLGVKNLEKFNMALLGKWVWRFKNEKNKLWARILCSKYGDRMENWSEESSGLHRASRWWRDLIIIKGWREGGREGWLENNLQRKVGRGDSVKFWYDKWVSDGYLKNEFERLFLISSHKEAWIRDMGEWSGGRWVWKLAWRRELFLWEENLVQILLQKIDGQQPKFDVEDTWTWVKDKSGMYTVKSAYLELIGDQAQHQRQLLKQLWSSLVPPKVAALCWKILLDRVPTKQNLSKRNCLPVGTSPTCVLCNHQEESTNHLFFDCEFVHARWMECYKWLNHQQVLPITFTQHFNQHNLIGLNKKGRTINRVIWFAMMWEIWHLRNKIIFRNDQTLRWNFLERVKQNSWIWITTFAREFTYPYPQWLLDPWKCMSHFN